MSPQSHPVLVLRFSAMGDVALLAPVLRSFLHAYPDFRLTVVSRPKFSAFFFGQERLTYFDADLDSTYSGMAGLFRLFLVVKKLKPEIVFDLHDHIRTRFICFFFRMMGVRIVRFDKGRKEKHALTRKENKIGVNLPHTVDRYHQAFSKAGFTFQILPSPHFTVPPLDDQEVDRWLTSQLIEKKEMWIGLAPFAAHKSKIWMLDNYQTLIQQTKEKMQVRFFLFGGGKNEIVFFNKLQSQFPHDCVVVAGQLNLSAELALMRKLDMMVCVDSSNMHLAALLGVPTLTVWGGTHPAAGFGPFGNMNKTVQILMDELPCRPCSVYGKEKCHRGDFACLVKIKPADVLAGMMELR